MAACSPTADAAIAANAAKITSFCNSDVIPTAQATPDVVAAAIPYGTTIKASSIAACLAVDTVAHSITTLPWLQENVQTLKTGKPATTPPITPAPVVAVATSS